MVQKKRNKFNATKVRDPLYGHFDSKLEYAHFIELTKAIGIGRIKDLIRQQSYPLHVNKQKIGSYRADFVFFDEMWGRTRVVDSKGLDTPFGKWKRKHLNAEYGIKVEIWIREKRFVGEEW